jgi:hypothetical protein
LAQATILDDFDDKTVSEALVGQATILTPSIHSARLLSTVPIRGPPAIGSELI